VPVSSFSGSGSSFYNTVSFAEDGHYTIEASLTDPAKNSASISFGEFTIDTTAPVIESITFDNNNARNDKYYNAGRTATITVVEHNFDPSLVTIDTNGTVGSWSSDGDVHTITVGFLTDGEYHLSVTATDKAGSTATQTVPDFVVDLTSPHIEFSIPQSGSGAYGESDRMAFGEDITPVITYTDEANLDAGACTYTLTGSKRGATTDGGASGGSNTTATAELPNLPVQVEFDDIYTLHAEMTDMAGNQAEGSITYSVNRFGSNFIVEDAAQYTENGGYLAEAPTVVVREINVSGAESENHGVSVTHDLTSRELQRKASAGAAGEGYSLEASENQYGWAEYEYVIPAANFMPKGTKAAGEGAAGADGNYHVVVTSVDLAKNLNNSASYYSPASHSTKSAEVDFVLDTQPPLVDIMDLAPGGVYDADSLTVTFSVTDTIGCEDVEVTLDGEPVEAAPAGGNMWTTEVPAKAFAGRTLEIVATDLAGNQGWAGIEGFHVTSNFVELHWPILVGVAVAAAALIAFLVHRRKTAAAAAAKAEVPRGAHRK